MKEVSQAYWKRALSALANAQDDLAKYPGGAVSRAYYAAFYAVSALFAERGQTFKNTPRSKRPSTWNWSNRDYGRPSWEGIFPNCFERETSAITS
ncbi:MAG: HEPN domain-containing protein [Thermodesulfobacteriota bacterium]